MSSLRKEKSENQSRSPEDTRVFYMATDRRSSSHGRR
jgi:hypothetical protein